jgi:hypothetical protein
MNEIDSLRGFPNRRIVLLEQSHKNNEELKSQLNQLQLEAKVLGFT